MGDTHTVITGDTDHGFLILVEKKSVKDEENQ